MDKSENIKKLMLTLFILFAMTLIAPHGVSANVNGISIEGNVCGLVIQASDEKVNTGNLNPGDLKNTSLLLRNTGSVPLTLYIRTNILSEATLNGGKLADILNLYIADGSNIINNELFRSAAGRGNILIGTMPAGSEKTIDFSVVFPGGAGNEYQGATVKANWTFTTTCSTGGGGGGGGGGDTGGGDDPLDVPDDPIPLGPAEEEPSEPEILITVDEDGIPAGPAAMPDTGELSPIYFLGAGAFIVMLGIVLRRK
ncbi:hypothetical protein [Desulfitibacter alkalitolerans]|uniref:hypothetical protein n=1 Tax=Desulfitibacter alkalitolerans TaxID=264641 RepID=UPI000488C0A1|nr:hypothetical protein [Desulfitibacter alkalitolerans]